MLVKMKRIIIFNSLFILLFMIYCTGSAHYRTDYQAGKRLNNKNQIIRGKASYYGHQFHGRKTANGEIFNMYKKTAAHRTLPFNSIIKVTNMENNKSVIVRINDRGPFHSERILDLSYRAAKEIDIISKGVVDIEIKIIKIGKEK
jgi:rare lipoprotein A